VDPRGILQARQAVEYDEFADARLLESILQAEQRVDSLVDGLLAVHARDELERSENCACVPPAVTALAAHG
jgi:hypothetical protein